MNNKNHLMKSFEKKKQETIKELQEWLSNPINNKDVWINENIEEINEELKEKPIQKSIRLPFQNMNIWFSSRFVSDMLSEKTSVLSESFSYNCYQNLVLVNELGKKYTNRPPSPMFKNCAYWLANLLREKWYSQAKECIQYINHWLTTTSLDGGQDYKTASWFIIQITNLGFVINLDYKKYNYPKDMGVYQDALDDWDSKDLKLIDQIVTKLCDYHLEQANYGDESENARRNDPMFIQFSQDDWFVFAFEVLSWLSVREMIGLENPTQFSHPMMHEALNKLVKNIAPIPTDNLYNQVIAKIDEI